MLKSHNKFQHSDIVSRPKFSWPGNKKLAVYLALNIEHFPFGEACGVDLDRATKPWSQRSWLWREYGNRIGGWRLLELFQQLDFPVGVIANTANYLHHPKLIAAYRDRGDELIAHGRSNAERQIDMDVAEERQMMREVTDLMSEHDGRRPSGWLSPYLTPSDATTDLLGELDYEYVLDWGICDEQPFWVNGKNGEILAMPYPIELNDQPVIVYRHTSAQEYAGMIIDAFDEMLARSQDTPLVFSVSLHSFIFGQPFRIVHLRKALEHILSHRDDIWLTVPREIARFYKKLPEAQQNHSGMRELA